MNASTKTSKSKKSRGFTLVEMLVVIGMIGALAGISFPVYKSIQRKVEKQQEDMFFTSIERAVDNFETEYNYLPYTTAAYPSGSQLIAGEGVWYWAAAYGGESRDILGILMGFGNNTCNFKSIAFLDEVREAEGNGPHAAPGPSGYSNGIVINESAGTATLYNSMGMHYAFRVDYDMDGTIENPFDSTDQISGKRFIWYTPEQASWGAPWKTSFPN
jgi:prepilin-type N-terminal cleavage/methylation domain-containing protein